MNELVNYLAEFLLPRRVELFDRVLEDRTRYITIALEDIYQPQNASAVLRTCDCLGIQDVHIIEKRNEYRTDPEVALGSSKWLNLITYPRTGNPSADAISALKSSGYRIIATTPHANDQLLDEIDLNKGKIALFFGTELTGLSEEVIDLADEYVRIPMYGFTESYNISVSAAITLHHLTHKLRASDLPWKLSESEKSAIKLDWLKSSVKSADKLIKRYQQSSQS